MKLILALTLLVFSTISFSNTIFFQCKSTAVPGVNPFTAKGAITTDVNSNAEGILDIQVQKINEVESLQVFEQVKISGSVKHYNPGEVTKNSFDQLILITDNPYLKSMNLLIDEKTFLSSEVLSLDNFLYRSNCESIPEIR